MKICTYCKEQKPLEAFRKQNSTKDGLKYYCKSCDDRTAKRYYKKNKKKNNYESNPMAKGQPNQSEEL